MTRVAGRRAAAALLLAGAVALPGSATAGAAGCAGVHGDAAFASIDLPVNAVPDATTVIGGRGTASRDVLLAALGRTVMRSPDGGCTWSAAVSLDAGGGTSAPWRASPTVVFWNIGAGPAGPGGAHAVYAVAGDTEGSLTVATPVVTYVSRDDGLHWTVHEPPVTAVTGDVPRCSQTFTTIAAGPVAGTAYLFCYISTLGELALTLAPVECTAALYVTTDYAATWRPVTGRLADQTTITPDDTSGCRDVARGQKVLVDPTTPHALWQVRPCETAVRESRDDGRTMHVFATLPRTPPFCEAGLTVGSVPRLGRVALSCDTRALLVMTRAGAPPDAAELHVKTAESGDFQGCALVPGTTRALGFVYDTAGRCRLYAYDLVRKRFTPAGFAPPAKDGCAWAKTAHIYVVPAPGARAVYARNPAAQGLLYRIGGG